MEQWKYRAVLCKLEEVKDEKGKKYWDWAITYTNSNQIIGLGNILNYEGSNGWELVNAVVEDFNSSGDGKTYRLFFKMRV